MIRLVKLRIAASDWYGRNAFVGVQFSFRMFFYMMCCDNEFKQRKIKLEPRVKLNHNIYPNVEKPDIFEIVCMFVI